MNEPHETPSDTKRVDGSGRWRRGGGGGDDDDARSVSAGLVIQASRRMSELGVRVIGCRTIVSPLFVRRRSVCDRAPHRGRSLEPKPRARIASRYEAITVLTGSSPSETRATRMRAERELDERVEMRRKNRAEGKPLSQLSPRLRTRIRV